MDHPKAGIKESNDGWVLEDKDIAGDPPIILNKEGLTVFKEKASEYKVYNTLKWTDW